MKNAIAPRADERTRLISHQCLSRIRMIVVDVMLLLHPASKERVMRLLRNCRRWGLKPPLVALEAHNDMETTAAEEFARTAADYTTFKIFRTERHHDVGKALELFGEEITAQDSYFEAKRQILFLTRRGGQGEPVFVSAFTGGGGTTCGVWTRIVDRKSDGTCTKGFLKASVGSGFCPVECRFCYLNAYQMDSMNLALNLEDLRSELIREWPGWPYPINFGETGGLIEYDRFLSEENGEGSIVQTVIDACAEANVIPFFLTKIAFPRYLTFRGNVKVGVSVMPEKIRPGIAPYGSPTDELLDSLKWAVTSGARHPVVRVFVLWEHRDLYRDLIKDCRDRLGTQGWQLTVDIPRFTPRTLSSIAQQYPEAASVFACELDPSGNRSASEIASAAHGDKKARPPLERQEEIYRGLRTMLDELGCQDVWVTACKGDPAELQPLAREKVIRPMPCACYSPKEVN